MQPSTKAILFGFLGSISLLVFYFFIMFLGKNSLSAALDQLLALRLWIFPLITTFGIEVGLFTYLKSKQHISGKSTVVSSTTSGVAMVACCAHHITDILPLVGFSLVATLLTTYQPLFFTIGIVSNIVAIFLLLRQVPFPSTIRKQLKITAILISPLLILGFGYLLITPTNATSSTNSNSENKTYQAQENDDKDVAVSATPEGLSSTQNVVFDITMNNHQYELSYNLTKIATLTDDKGNTYKPISWNGSTGGHHVSGKLVFPQLTGGVSSVTLTLPQIAGVDRIFTWKL